MVDDASVVQSVEGDTATDSGLEDVSGNTLIGVLVLPDVAVTLLGVGSVEVILPVRAVDAEEGRGLPDLAGVDAAGVALAAVAVGSGGGVHLVDVGGVEVVGVRDVVRAKELDGLGLGASHWVGVQLSGSSLHRLDGGWLIHL